MSASRATSAEKKAKMQLSVVETQMVVEPPPQQAEDTSAEAGFKQVLNACLG
eukprot:CAMPEP_0115083440 /NCGR_PEP_ID=MMETSP0227-20121206/20547_1 /TAXON_ID=89957 /ORGANISM="Polarella glacialis, Strain CCMP 1383" /LENGTH=51 /DNA_ID=CAMNT_0002471819 /DNA_START=125 /DNA_END=276 /DNA_ORIENTATION=+